MSSIWRRAGFAYTDQASAKPLKGAAQMPDRLRAANASNSAPVSN
jgi:hypothetical protein